MAESSSYTLRFAAAVAAAAAAAAAVAAAVSNERSGQHVQRQTRLYVYLVVEMGRRAEG